MNRAFLVYLIFLMSVGIYFYFKTGNLEQYLLGGRGLAWLTDLSVQARDMSCWLFLGLPGAIYLFGVNQIYCTKTPYCYRRNSNDNLSYVCFLGLGCFRKAF